MPMVNTTRRRGAFTLIELLVVIGIIALLLGILLPAFGRVQDLAQVTSTQARISSLDGACEAFKQDIGAYPGLNRWPVGSQANIHLLGVLNSGALSGSQVLSMCLMDLYVPGPDEDWIPMATYLAGTSSTTDDRPSRVYLDGTESTTDDSGVLTGRRHTLLDTFTRQGGPMPILYFVARPGQTGLSSIYKAEDNLDMGTGYPAPAATGDFHRAITQSPGDPTTVVDFSVPTVKPYRADSFILIAPGIDRLWFTGDDLVNFSK